MSVRDAIIHDDYRWVEISPWDKSLTADQDQPAPKCKAGREDQQSAPMPCATCPVAIAAQ